MSKKYKYDLRSMEDDCLEAYLRMSKEENEQNKTDVFKTIYELALAILNVGKYEKYGIDYELTSYEYALYLFERLLTRSFVPQYEDRFPWQQYMSLNIQHIIHSKREDITWQELVRDVEFLLDESDQIAELPDRDTTTMEDRIGNKFEYKKLVHDLIETMKLYYTYEHIKNTMPLAMDLIFSDKRNLVNKHLPDEIRIFVITMVSISKRLVSKNNINKTHLDLDNTEVKKVFSAAVKSSVFLASVSEPSIFSKEMMLSLDIDSLYRLVSVKGGETIRIPTQRELDSLIGAVVTISKIIMEGEDIEKALAKCKDDFGLVFAHNINIRNFISKIVESYAIGSTDKSSTPIFNMLISSVTSMEKMLVNMAQEKKDTGVMLDQFKALSETFSTVSNSLIKITGDLEKKQGEMLNEVTA